jgi:hypothetical protein
VGQGAGRAVLAAHAVGVGEDLVRARTLIRDEGTITKKTVEFPLDAFPAHWGHSCFLI